jgi:hypothetical protein
VDGLSSTAWRDVDNVSIHRADPKVSEVRVPDTFQLGAISAFFDF